MENLIHDHPDKEVRAAAIRLLDALTMWERRTGRQNLVIIKDSVGCQFRSLSGAPIPNSVTDEQLIEAFRNIPS